MTKDELARHRRSHWLRSERAFGLDSVRIPQPVGPNRIEPDPPATLSQPTSQTPLFAANGEPESAPMMGEALTREEKIARLAQMDAGEVKPCTRCRLCEARKNTVFGEGDPDAKIFFSPALMSDPARQRTIPQPGSRSMRS